MRLRLRGERPEVAVREDEYRRLLGLPPGYVLDGRVGELVQGARDWYSAHGRPWLVAREVDSLRLEGDVVGVDGLDLASAALVERFRRAAAESAVVAGVGAGAEAGDEARRLWNDGRPDEYFFLEAFAAAVVEQLVTDLGAQLCAWADAGERVVLPHYSPGYPGWELADQQPLLELLARGGESLPGPLEVLWSGQLRPRHSLLALFGVAPKTAEAATDLAALVPCTACSFAPCAFRRAPHHPSEYHFARHALASPAAQQVWRAIASRSGGSTT